MDFTGEEKILMMLYSPGDRPGLYQALGEMRRQLEYDERELRALTDRVMEKLEKLPGNVKNRELFFIGQSANGYLGWIRRAAAARRSFTRASQPNCPTRLPASRARSTRSSSVLLHTSLP